MTFYLGYFLDFISIGVNTTTHILFPFVLALVVLWYIFLEIFIPYSLQHPRKK
jgi:hypothetical protein